MNPNLNFLDPLSNWGRFFAALDLELLLAEVRYGFPGRAPAARATLIKKAANDGATGWVNVPEPELSAAQYVEAVYTGSPMPHNVAEILK